MLLCWYSCVKCLTSYSHESSINDRFIPQKHEQHDSTISQILYYNVLQSCWEKLSSSSPSCRYCQNWAQKSDWHNTTSCNLARRLVSLHLLHYNHIRYYDIELQSLQTERTIGLLNVPEMIHGGEHSQNDAMCIGSLAWWMVSLHMPSYNYTLYYNRLLRVFR